MPVGDDIVDEEGKKKEAVICCCLDVFVALRSIQIARLKIWAGA
jgi:hypothetical protein